MLPPPSTDVAINILRSSDGRVLMAERTGRQVAAGFWELPGGKVDPGETPQAAALRELEEEIGVQALAVRPWIRYEHLYRTRRLRLFFFRIERWSGTPTGREGQRIAWVDPAAPEVAPILPSVDRVLLGLGLPALYAVAQVERPGDARSCLERLATALRSGLRLIQVRAPRMAPDQRIAFARQVDALARPFGARVLLLGSALEARRAGLSALHSTAAELKRLHSRPPVRLWVASCHEAGDLARAGELGADAAVLSPVLFCREHPERPALGWEGLRRLTSSAMMPVYAGGGLTPGQLAAAQSAGAIGVATADFTEAHMPGIREAEPGRKSDELSPPRGVLGWR
jgi:8-oxo-dGTP diphosphatase